MQQYIMAKKVNSQNLNFMRESDVLTAMKSKKNCVGHNRFPSRILSDGTQFLLKPMLILFNKI